MNLFVKRMLFLNALLLIFVFLTNPALAQDSVKVTFKVNTATFPDTMREDGFVQVRGGIAENGEYVEGNNLPGGGFFGWSSNSAIVLDNVGGDYWEGTFDVFVGDTLSYKYFGDTPAEGDPHGGGWEGGFNDVQGVNRDTRILIVGDQDTTLDLAYFHSGSGLVDPDWKPFDTKEDTVAIYFRVNMGGYVEQGLFDPSVVEDTVGARGGPPLGDNDWTNTEVIMTRENNSVNDSSFYSGVVYIPKDSITVGNTQKYKFVFGDVIGKGSLDWESTPDREFVYTTNLVNTMMDTTLHWVYFSNQPYVGKTPVESNITFRVSTEAVEGLDLFDRGVGDAIYVIGPNGFDIPDDLIPMSFIPALQEWATTETFSRVPETEIAYKYFIRWDSSRVDSLSPNYIPNLVMRGINDPNEDSGWEEPSSTGGADRKHVWQNSPTQTLPGDFGFDRQFFNGAPANSWFDKAIEITWTVDMRPATSAATNTKDLFTPGVTGFDSVWVQFDGSLFALSQGWRTFGIRAVLLTDTDGDTIYTGSYTVDPPGWYQLGFIITYNHPTTAGTYVTNGGGTQKGRRYYQFIDPDEILPSGGQFPQPVWPDAFSLDTLVWKENDLPFEQPPNLTQPTGIEDELVNLPNQFALEQNYPNPFNPTTTIKYELAKNSEVSITVYNVRGQKVVTLVDGRQNAGKHNVIWNGKNQGGNHVASGIYFIKMKAADFTQVRKMTLLK